MTGINLKFNYMNQEKKPEQDQQNNELQINKNNLNDFSEKSVQSISGSSIKGDTSNESPAKSEMRKYIKQLLNEELQSQQIREKLSLKLNGED